VAWLRMRDDFQLAQDAIGLLYITTSAAYFAASFISGRLIGRFGIAPSLIISTVLEVIGLVGYAVSPSWGLIVTLGFVVGFGGGLGGVLLDAGLNLLFAVNYGPRLMNWLHASFGVGTILGPAMMTAIIVSGGSWKMGFLLSAALYVALAITYALTRKWWVVSG